MPVEKPPVSVGPHLYGRPLTEGEIKALPPDANVISFFKDDGIPSRFGVETAGRFLYGGFSLYNHFLISLPPGAADPPPPCFKVGQCVESLAGHRGVVTETYVKSDGLRRYTVRLPGEGAGHLPGFLETELRELPGYDAAPRVTASQAPLGNWKVAYECGDIGEKAVLRDRLERERRAFEGLSALLDSTIADCMSKDRDLREAESVALGRTREADALRIERDDLQRDVKRLEWENGNKSQNIRKQAETIERLKGEALRHYAHDGTYRVLDSAEDVVKARIDAAGEIDRLRTDLHVARAEYDKEFVARRKAEFRLGSVLAENATLDARLEELKFYGRPLTQEDADKLPPDAMLVRFWKGEPESHQGWRVMNSESRWGNSERIVTFLLSLPETGR